MPLEPEGFREQLARLDESFPFIEALTIQQACQITDTDRRVLTNDKTFPLKKLGGKIIVSKVKLAMWLVK